MVTPLPRVRLCAPEPRNLERHSGRGRHHDVLVVLDRLHRDLAAIGQAPSQAWNQVVGPDGEDAGEASVGAWHGRCDVDDIRELGMLAIDPSAERGPILEAPVGDRPGDLVELALGQDGLRVAASRSQPPEGDERWQQEHTQRNEDVQHGERNHQAEGEGRAPPGLLKQPRCGGPLRDGQHGNDDRASQVSTREVGSPGRPRRQAARSHQPNRGDDEGSRAHEQPERQRRAVPVGGCRVDCPRECHDRGSQEHDHQQAATHTDPV